MAGVPTFADSLREAERRLSRLLGGRCEISVHLRLDEGLMAVLEAIDHEKFRQELWYDRSELESRGGSRGFLCLVASLDGVAIAFDYGYDGDEEGTFFSDSTATLVEGRGVGSTLFALEIIRSYELGYRRTRLSTEEVDEAGRPLRRIWGRLGFEVVSTDPSGGVEMELTHTPEVIRSLYDKYVSDVPPSV
jgi:hypothetical protein